MNTRPSILCGDQPEGPVTTPGMKCGGGERGPSGQIVWAANAGKQRVAGEGGGMSRLPSPVTYTLPTPPSVNQMYANVGKRRVKSDRYRTWRRAAENELLAQQRVCFEGEVQVRIQVPENARRDLDNHIKPILDLLVYARVLSDDNSRHVRALWAGWGAKGSATTVTVEAI